METNEIIDEIQEFVDAKVNYLNDLDYCEVLEEISSNLSSSATCKREELENEN